MVKLNMSKSHNNISPLDSRYASKIENTRAIFSEANLIKVRFELEIDWLLFLCQKLPKNFPVISKASIDKILKFKNSFDDKSVIAIKKIESTTNHDVKAVEYYIRNFFLKDKVLSKYIHLIHFALTSEDLNSLSYAVILKNGVSEHLSILNELQKLLLKQTKQWSKISMLARTHGQPASPSTLGKEFKVFHSRLNKQINNLKSIQPLAKWSGATGNFHTFNIVDESLNWPKICSQFINQCGIQQNLFTTQIEPHDWIAETSHSMIRINNILIDLNQDIWMYITNDLFKLKLMENEVGSSTMPHKVNPIDFENSEGNLGIANSLLDFFANKLQKSRMQRDLSDSTVLRNVGLGFGYSALSVASLKKGLGKLSPNKEKLKSELDSNWEVLTEAVQTIMRYEGIADAYEQLKELSRGSSINKEDYLTFVNGLSITSESKAKLLKLTPSSYIGIAESLAKS